MVSFSGVVPALAVVSHPVCRQVLLEGEVAAGQGFERPFTKNLKFYLEPLRSGWIVRVLAVNEPRGAHDYAELATPPYQSVSPLLISTDWAFRAQDAVAWNPRHFHFAMDRTTFRTLEQNQPSALAGEPAGTAKVAELAAVQPEGTIELLDARFAPGLADQAKMASVVALHLATTPHVADESAPPTPLGHLESIRFRVRLDVPTTQEIAGGTQVQTVPCAPKPTTIMLPASERVHSKPTK